MEIIFTVLWLFAFIWTLTTARDNNRSMFIWGVVALVFSPLLALVCLWLLGKNYGN
ncbi:hypothetical protein GAP32_087 [Cronobacter phage vB_CsaM_GAP32]|uniref:Putative membrane protein n=1 Tax=Cronobacter phage vB_CsaM_GAP32 TaxID=1141136 RepID=K4F9G4_9CAUD|nr:hypothetical protein GAP32_087 [Cronobacter phage vB_CsaM_GAP32]AFC21535.1 putative membrane protein [Cronobacter phage vB_CsaM_GAP32]